MTRLDDLLNKRPRTFYNDFARNVDDLSSGILFMYASWGITHIQLISLITSLEDFPDIDLFVFDIDAPEFIEYRLRNNLHSDGWGETFWVKSGKIVSSEKKYDINIEPSIMEMLKVNHRGLQ